MANLKKLNDDIKRAKARKKPAESAKVVTTEDIRVIVHEVLAGAVDD